MLDVNRLQRKIQEGIQTIIVPAIKDMELARHSEQTKNATAMAEQVSEIFDESVSEALSQVIANAIHYYIKHISIEGTIITMGSPTTQVATIMSLPMPVLNGVVPNTLGIS